jgi:Holliday junction resolvase
MTAPSKRKGNALERELVKDAEAVGLEARRAWGSDGRSMGWGAEVDVLVQGLRVQAKKRARLPSYLHVPEGADATVFRENRGETWVLLRWRDLLDKLNKGGW